MIWCVFLQCGLQKDHYNFLNAAISCEAAPHLKYLTKIKVRYSFVKNKDTVQSNVYVENVIMSYKQMH